MESGKKGTVVSNLMWRFAERFGAQSVAFVVSIILARLLDPESYGTIALVTVFTTILQVFVDSGLGNALIQKRDADDLDFSSVFYFNIFMCLLLYLGIFSAAPLISSFYGQTELTPVVQVLSLTLVISGVKNIQQAYASREMLFKRFFFATLGGTIGGAVIGIIMAYAGFGVWALVVQQIFSTTLDTIILWITVKWHPKLMFSIKRLKVLFSFGWKLLVSSLIDTVYNDIRQLMIGKLYSPADLACFNRGKQFPNLIVININKSIDSVLFTVLSQQQNDKCRVRSMTRRAIRTSSYIMWPLMIGLMATAEPVVNLILTNKWIACVPFLQVFCFIYGFYPIHTSNLNAIKALGRSDIFLKLEIIKKIIGITVLFLTMRFGVLMMAYSLLFTTVISSFINAYPNKKLLDYDYFEQVKDILPSLLLATVMGIIIYPIQLLQLSDWLTLLIQVPLGGIVYIAGSKLLRFDNFEYVWSTVKQIMWKSVRKRFVS